MINISSTRCSLIPNNNFTPTAADPDLYKMEKNRYKGTFGDGTSAQNLNSVDLRRGELIK